MDTPCKHSSGHIFDSPVMKLGQNAFLGNSSDELDGSGERSRAIMALLFTIWIIILEKQSSKWSEILHKN
jgi:hypothetical protein